MISTISMHAILVCLVALNAPAYTQSTANIHDSKEHNAMHYVLVTGGAGFLGSNLARRLHSEGYHVVVVDNFSSGSRDKIADLIDQDRFTLIEHDITIPRSWPYQFDMIFNLACPASPPRYQADPIHTMMTCVLGTKNMLDLAKAHGARILQASTSEIYGDPLEHPQKESYRGHVNSIGIRSCYDEGKRAAEALMFDYHRCHQIPIKVIRIFNTYGPGMDIDDGRVVSNFIVRALRNEPLEMYGSGEQTRSFCYVDDLIEGICRVMNTPSTITGPINLGNPHEFTLQQLAATLRALVGHELPITYKPLPADDPQRRQPDIAYAQSIISWQPTVGLEEGLRRTLAYFKTMV